MAKRVTVAHAKSLMGALSEKSGHSQEHYGFGVMSDLIGGSITQKYLYENIFRAIDKAEDEDVEQLSLSPGKLDELARYLEFKSFDDFIRSIEDPIDPILESCEGSYYSYVRRSSATGVVFQSPVQILKDDHKVWLTLKGPARDYYGELRLEHGCLFCLMQSEEGKIFQHIYRIGIRKKPQLLTGVFSGISTASHPIGGRVVLIRQNEAFGKLQNREIPVEELKCSSELYDRRLGQYFTSFGENNLLINNPVTFSLDELGDCS